MPKWITRKKTGRQYAYYADTERITDEEEIARINTLAIPPAWKNVEISPSQKAKVQARGVDSSGRTQSIYHPDFRLKQEKAKFDRILRFADALPKLRAQVEADLRKRQLSKEKVLACIVRLIDEAYFRVGNERYAAEHQTYGITTLRSKHTTVTGTTVTFDFVGKSGKRHHKKIKNSQLARIIKQLDELPGHEIFRYQDDAGMMHDLHAKDVNEYIKTYMGEEFTAKDFRTWGGTLLATTEIIKDTLDDSASETARKKAITKVVKRVAKKLGNTPAVARGSYIDPRVIDAYEDRVSVPQLRTTIKNMRPRKYMSVDEQCVLRLIQPQ